MPLLSIIMPVSQTKASHLAEAIASLINASPADSEIHIGLDGPYGEAGLKVLDQLQSRNKSSNIRISQFKRLGLASTLNALIEQSDCHYLARQDSDDICLPNRLQAQLQALQSQPSASFCGTQITRCDVNLQPHQRQRRYPLSFPAQLIYASLLNNPIAHPTLMIKCDLLQSTTYRAVAGAEDWDLYIRLWQEGYRSFNLDQSGLLYRIHPQQVTQQRRNSQLLRDLKSRSLQAAAQHHRNSNLLKPIQQLGNATRFTEMAIHAKGWVDQ
jgi:hypothetical protein